MRYLAILWVIGTSVILSGCSSPKMAVKYPAVKINQDLSHWITTDPATGMKKGRPDPKIWNYNMERLRDDVNTEKSSPYWGESIYYMLQDLFRK